MPPDVGLSAEELSALHDCFLQRCGASVDVRRRRRSDSEKDVKRVLEPFACAGTKYVDIA